MRQNEREGVILKVSPGLLTSRRRLVHDLAEELPILLTKRVRVD